MKENPIPKEEREVFNWIVGQSYEAGQDVELVLCNIKANGKMNVRYAIVDSEFFMLVEPDFTSISGQNYKVKIQIKQPLKLVEAMIDKTEPRNLIVGLVTLQKGHTKVIFPL
jgi:hypothetical protein